VLVVSLVVVLVVYCFHIVVVVFFDFVAMLPTPQPLPLACRSQNRLASRMMPATCDSNKGGRRVKAEATNRAIAIATRVANKMMGMATVARAMVMATKMVGEQQQGQWWQQQLWWATMRTMAAAMSKQRRG
jgi:hypothetical protein